MIRGPKAVLWEVKWITSQACETPEGNVTGNENTDADTYLVEIVKLFKFTH